MNRHLSSISTMSLLLCMAVCLLHCKPPVKVVATFPKTFILTITKVDPVIFGPGIPVRVFFQLTNQSADVANGFVKADFEGPGNSPEAALVVKLQPGQTMTGSIKLQSPPVCYTNIVEATYLQTAEVGLTLIGSQKTTIMAHDLMAFGLPPGIVDNDHDFMDDGLEHHLLEKFRPLFKFSIDGGVEKYAPISALWYIGHGQAGAGFSNILQTQCQPVNNFNQALLVSDPTALLTLSDPDPKLGSSSLVNNQSKSNYHVIASDLAEHGGPWDAVLSARNIGLYGHVVPVVLPSSLVYKRDTVFGCGVPGSDRLFYKVEYWQFFGYNYAHQEVVDIKKITDHQSDWTTVQLLIDAQTEAIVSIFHYAHGEEMRFDLDPSMPIVPGSADGGKGKLIGTVTGPNARSFGPNLDIAGTDGAFKDNAYVRLFREDENSPFTHPVVYIENGSHEFWPTENGRFGQTISGLTFYSPLHNGDDVQHSNFTDTPPNLGEVGFPLPETVEAQVILHYNGYWGCFNLANNPPPGPPLHTEWTYPFSSKFFVPLRSALEN